MTNEQTEFYNDLMNKQIEKLVKWAYRHTGDEELAKDAVQTVFLRLIVEIDTVYNHEAVALRQCCKNFSYKMQNLRAF